MAVTVKTGNYFYEHGYVMVSNLLLDYQERLGLTNDEVLFIIKVYRHKNGYKLHDTNLDNTISTKTLQRRRKSLVEKGYLSFTLHKSNTEDGTIKTEGIVYDFTTLDVALMEIASELNEKESEVKVSKKEKEVEKDDCLSEFKKEYYKRYKMNYTVSEAEKRKIKSLKKDQVESLKYIFDYVDDNIDNLPEGFHPRIAFFTQLDWRMEKLVEYTSIKKEMETEELIREIEIVEEENAYKDYKSLFTTEIEEEAFKKYLLKNNRSLFLRMNNSLMKNIVDNIKEEYKKFLGEYNAK